MVRVLVAIGWLIVAVLAPSTAAAADPLYDTRNGLKTAAQIAAELRIIGYTGPGDVRSMLRAYEHAAPSGTVDYDVVLAADWVQSYWSKAESYLVQNSGSNTPCGPLHLAYYCNRDRTVYIDRTWFAQTVERYGSETIFTVVGHEFAHLNQDELGILSYMAPMAYEQQADCLAGATVAWVAASTNLTPDFARIAAFYAISGDRTHGYGYAREGAWQTGYYGGAAAC